MNVILITGGLGYKNADTIGTVLDQYPAGSLVIHGGARGADTISHRQARLRCMHTAEVPYAGWMRGAGGPVRNGVMVMMASALRDAGHIVHCHAFGGDDGTDDCVRQARAAGIDVYEHDR